MLVARRMTDVSEFTPPQKGEPKTSFTTGLIDPFLWSWIEDETTNFQMGQNGSTNAPPQVKVNLSRRNLLLVRFGLRHVTNLVDKEGKAITLRMEKIYVPGVGERQGLALESMDAVSSWITPLAHKIYEDNTVTEQEEKN